MLNLFIKFSIWVNKNKYLAVFLYLALPFFSSYIYINQNYSWDLMSIMLLILFVFRIIVGFVIWVYILSFIKFNKKKNPRKVVTTKIIGFIIFKLSIGLLIIVLPLIFSDNYSKNFITNKLDSESAIINGEIYHLEYWNNHIGGSKGYRYEFYVDKDRYTGDAVEREGEIGKIIKVRYYKNNPWVNKKIK